ncbi:MAG: 3'-5' exonuclease, partial [Bacteroidota bacterium]
GEDEMKTLDIFMQDIALMTDAEKEDPTDTDKVSLMTIHAAKGLEFPYVYLVGVEENLFPSQMSLSSRTDLEEERRLFYVAITRAMEQICISYAETRFRFGQFTICEPSRFIDEIDINYVIHHHKNKSGGPKSMKESFSESRNKFSSTPNPTSSVKEEIQKNGKKKQEEQQQDGLFQNVTVDQLKPGMNIQHQRFGFGKIEQIEGRGENSKATVVFNNFGKKQLLLKFAKLRLL